MTLYQNLKLSRDKMVDELEKDGCVCVCGGGGGGEMQFNYSGKMGCVLHAEYVLIPKK